MSLPEQFYLGASSWTAPSWRGPFYPEDLPGPEWIRHYANHFRSVEVDATWYRAPSARTVDGWRERTPDDFVFSAKAPQTITHEKIMVDCVGELEGFLTSMRRLGPKLGVILLQFPYFRKDKIPHLPAFLERLEPFLPLLPRDIRFALEVRNKTWLQPPLFEALRSHGVALAWVDHPWMPTAREYARRRGAMTADFLYVRWLGDRYGIEEITKDWDRLVLDRVQETELWAEVLSEFNHRANRIFAYYNNHYAGCGYQSAALFEQAWDRVAARPRVP